MDGSGLATRPGVTAVAAVRAGDRLQPTAGAKHGEVAAVEVEPTGGQRTPGTLEGGLVRLRPVSAADLPALLAILEEPEVARWWRRAEWERVDERDAITVVIELKAAGAIAGAGGAAVAAGGQAVAGCIQYTEETDPDYFSAAVDIFVATAAQGRGVGPDTMRTLIAWLFDVRGHHRVTVDPAAENARAIHVYEELGFRPVGVLRQYERVADGVWRDALLMELLAGDFRR
jgi:aminoglycoside 6'-N-acetyltransferase